MKREPSSPEGYILRWATVAIRRTWRTLQREVGLLWIVAPWLVFASVAVGVLIARPEGRFQSDGQARVLCIALYVGAIIAGESALAMSYVLRTGQFVMRTLEYLLASFTLFPLLPWLGSYFIQSSYGNLLWSSRLDLAYLCPVLMLGMVAVYWPYRYLRGWLLVRLPAITRRSQDSCVLQRSDTQLTLRSLMLTITAVAVAPQLGTHYRFSSCRRLCKCDCSGRDQFGNDDAHVWILARQS